MRRRAGPGQRPDRLSPDRLSPDGLSRGGLFGWLLLAAAANGLAVPVIAAVHERGWAAAIGDAFDVSAVVWIAAAAGLLLYRGQLDPAAPSRRDFAVAGLLLPLLLAPLGQAAWLAATLACLYLLAQGMPAGPRRRGVVILLATTVPMLWSPTVFQLFSAPLLRADAWLVSQLVGTPRLGNMVGFVHGGGYLVVFPACSSLANMSIAMLCWVAVGQLVGHAWTRHDIGWALLICAVMVAANVGRMSVMALSAGHYLAMHGPGGDAFVNVATTAAVVVLSLAGVRHDLVASR